MSVKINKLLELLNNIAPNSLAEEWDNTGLLLDTGKDDINKIMVTLEINEAVIKEAVEQRIDLIICHHPFIFKGLKSVRGNDYTGRMLINLIKEDIAVFTAHTSFDSALGGNNDYLGQIIGLDNMKPLLTQNIEDFYKLVVFVPVEALKKVHKAICDAGAGKINDYKDCTFYQSGTGTFTPLENADPYIGKINEFEEVEEFRLESIVPKSTLHNVIREMLISHPYEEPAYDIYKLENTIKSVGLGRTGELKEEATLEDICRLLKTKLKIDEPIPFVGNKEQKIKKIALCTGSGAEFLSKAAEIGCQLYITGDVKYHDAQLALQLGIALIDAKHFHTEKIFSENMAKQLIDVLGGSVAIIESKANINPFQYI
ncbi:MAG: Nif3-like dinuclear metal center hexameric protein [Clostridiales bacterium]|nr:Nif3-like dinuclear metal center hexameric protein [Clostridiales bacterium]